MRTIKEATQNHPRDNFVTINDCITHGEIQDLIEKAAKVDQLEEEIKQLRFAVELRDTANRILGAKLLAGREDKLVRVPGKKPGAMKFFTKLGSEVPA